MWLIGFWFGDQLDFGFLSLWILVSFRFGSGLIGLIFGLGLVTFPKIGRINIILGFES